MQENKDIRFETRGTLRVIYWILSITLVFATGIFAWYINVRIDWRKGTAISASLFLEGILYSLTYSFFSKIYGAHELEQKRFSGLLFGQILSFALSDVCLFGAAFVWFHNLEETFVSRYLAVYLIQIILSANLTLIFCKLFRRYTQPKNILILYKDSARSRDKDAESGLKTPQEDPECQVQARASTWQDFEKIVRQKRWQPYYQVYDVLPDSTPMKELISVISLCDELYLFDLDKEMVDRLTIYGAINHRRMFVTPKVSDILTMRGEVLVTFGIPFVEAHGFQTAWYYPVVKRAFDIFAAVLVLIGLSPLFLAVGIINQVQMRKGFLTHEVCLTKGGFIFNLYHYDGMDENHSRFAAWAKRTRIDRLPEFISVLRGGMSIVGPTPVEKSLAWSYIREIPDYRIRHNAKAGITGYAQVWCPPQAPFLDRLKMDQVYCSQMSVYHDLRILFYSIKRWVEKIRKGGVV